MQFKHFHFHSRYFETHSRTTLRLIGRGLQSNRYYIACYMRRIWAHEISFSVPRPRDTAHPGSGPAQSLLRICSGLLTFAQAKYHFRHAVPQHA